MDDIEQWVRDKSGQEDWDIPLPRPGKMWAHLFCPFCEPTQRKRTGRKPRRTAAINYDAGWFECYRCGTTPARNGEKYPKNDARLVALLREHEPLIRRMVRKVSRKFGKWVDIQDLWSYAEEMIWNYAYRPYGGKNDAGMWDEWEAQAGGDPRIFRKYLGAALGGDLMNYAESQKGWKHHGGLTEVPAGGDVEVITAETLATHSGGESYLASLVDYRTDVRHKASGAQGADGFMSGGQGNREPSGRGDLSEFCLGYAEREDVPFTSWARCILRCDLDRNGLGPVKGHCEWCNGKFRMPAGASLGEWLLHHGGLSHRWWHCEPTELTDAEIRAWQPRDLASIAVNRDDQQEPDLHV